MKAKERDHDPAEAPLQMDQCGDGEDFAPTTLTGGKKSKPVGEPVHGKHTSVKRGLQWPRGPALCPMAGSAAFLAASHPRRRPWGGGMPYPGSAGSAPRISCPITDASNPRDFWTMRAAEDPGHIQGTAGLCQKVGDPNRCFHETLSMRNLRGVCPPWWPSSGGDIVEASLLKPTEEKCGPSPTLEEEAISPRWGNWAATEVPGSLPECNRKSPWGCRTCTE